MLVAASGLSSDATAALQAVFNNRYFKIPKPTSCYICPHTEVYSVLITLVCCFISRCAMPASTRARRQQSLLSEGPRTVFAHTLSRHLGAPATSGPPPCLRSANQLCWNHYTSPSPKNVCFCPSSSALSRVLQLSRPEKPSGVLTQSLHAASYFR